VTVLTATPRGPTPTPIGGTTRLPLAASITETVSLLLFDT
jgi:hypothetical protein